MTLHPGLTAHPSDTAAVAAQACAAYETAVSAPEPFFDLDAVIRAAEAAIDTCMTLADRARSLGKIAEYERHCDRAQWYRARLTLWKGERDGE